MIKAEGFHAESFIRKASTMRMTGMKISIMEIAGYTMATVLQATPAPHV
jgi:hypothetical protein